MLVLSRKKNESIVIGDALITLTVVDIRGDKVRIGIEAPKECPVHRQEVYNAIQREKAGQRPQEIGVLDRPFCPICTQLNPIINGTTYVCEGCGHSWVIPA